MAFVGDFGLVALASFGERHRRTMLAVRCERAMETGQVNAGLRYQSGQSCDEVQWFEDHMRGAIAVRGLELASAPLANTAALPWLNDSS